MEVEGGLLDLGAWGLSAEQLAVPQRTRKLVILRVLVRGVPGAQVRALTATNTIASEGEAVSVKCVIRCHEFSKTQ
eukprot:COSAG05_NODE_2022_length_3681_cov_2.202959_1_plen_76_part_00